MGRALAYGPLTALDDRPRPGKEPTITPEAKAWLVSLACDKAKDHGYPHELWTTRLLARHARENASAAGNECLAKLVQGTACKILGQEEIKPHKVRYYLERRDAEFEQKWRRFCAFIARSRSKKGCQISETAPAGSHRLDQVSGFVRPEACVMAQLWLARRYGAVRPEFRYYWKGQDARKSRR